MFFCPANRVWGQNRGAGMHCSKCGLHSGVVQYCLLYTSGGLFDEELCFVYADSVSELLGQPEPVYHGYSSTAQHRMLVIPEEHWAKALKLLYAEKFDWSRLVYDITYTSIGAAVVEDFYDENVVFLRFCFEKELLKKNPLDRYDLSLIHI